MKQEPTKPMGLKWLKSLPVGTVLMPEGGPPKMVIWKKGWIWLNRGDAYFWSAVVGDGPFHSASPETWRKWEPDWQKTEAELARLRAIVDEYYMEKCCDTGCIDCGWADADGVRCNSPAKKAVDRRWKPREAAKDARG